jgi:hypothetical protein
MEANLAKGEINQLISTLFVNLGRYKKMLHSISIPSGCVLIPLKVFVFCLIVKSRDNNYRIPSPIPLL